MDEIMDILINCMLFMGLSHKEIRQYILPQGKLREYPKGVYILSPGEKLSSFGVVLSGRINNQYIFGDGSYSLINRINTGAVFGADLICTRSGISPYHSVTTADTRLLMFSGELLNESGILPEDIRKRIMEKMLVLLSHESMRKDYRLAILARKGLRDRVLTYLRLQADRRHCSSFAVPFTRDEMASYLCVNRSALSHELSLMRSEGIIDFHKNVFTLLRRE